MTAWMLGALTTLILIALVILIVVVDGGFRALQAQLAEQAQRLDAARPDAAAARRMTAQTARLLDQVERGEIPALRPDAGGRADADLVDRLSRRGRAADDFV